MCTRIFMAELFCNRENWKQHRWINLKNKVDRKQNIGEFLLYIFCICFRKKQNNAIYIVQLKFMTVFTSEEEGMKLNGTRKRKMEDVNFIYIFLFIFLKRAEVILQNGKFQWVGSCVFIIYHLCIFLFFFQMKQKRDTLILHSVN